MTLAAFAIASCAGTRSPEPRAAVAGTRTPVHGTKRALLDGVRQVSGGMSHTCALRSDASVLCWGENGVGQLGDGTRQSRRAPVRVRALPPARWVAAGAGSTCAATLEGELYCWGANSIGQLGNGQAANGYTMPVPVSGVTDALHTSGSVAAPRHCAIGEASALSCWGRLSLHGADGRPMLASPTPEPEVDVRDPVAMAIGASHECVLTERGGVLCRGHGMHGELGTPTTDVLTRFAAVPGLEAVVAIAAGTAHTCAVTNGGAAFCWGDGARGQLGAASTPESPRVRVALPVPVRAIAAGDAHTCALGSLGQVYCWGENLHAQLGDGEIGGAGSAPRLVRIRERVQDLAAGGRHTCALLVGGELRCWGDNLAGQLGDGTNGDRVWPVAVLDARDDGGTIAVAG